MGKHNLVGAWGEAVAADYLRKKRYTILAAGYRCRFGEIDLIAQKGRFLAFVEVKTRSSDQFALAREFVDSRKQQRLRCAAAMYLEQYPTELQPRFDVIEVYAAQGMETRRPKIQHLEDAFS